MTKKFEEEKIEFLSPRDAVRTRSGMYVGSLDNPSVLLREIINNSEDELSSGYGNSILISNNFNGFNFVGDNGRGIPISMSPDKPDKTQAYLSISELHSGSKFNKNVNLMGTTGMNGVGSSAVNFLSDEYWLISRIGEHNYNRSIPDVEKVWNESGPRVRKELYYFVKCEKGIKTLESAGRLGDIEKLIFKDVPGQPQPIPRDLSTIVFFKPDPTIFESVKTEIPAKDLQYFLLIQEKFFGRKLDVYVDGQKINNTFKPYKFELLRTIIPKNTTYNKQVGVYITFEADSKLGPKNLTGSVNGLSSNTGQHIQIGESVFKTAIKDYYKIKHEYLSTGLQMCIVILASEVTFDSQTKTRLSSISKVKVTDFVDVVKDIEKIFKKNPEYWDLHAEKLNQYADSLTKIGAISKAQKIIDAASNGGSGLYKLKSNLIEGFVDATAPSNDRWNCSILITEGLSPAGSLKAARKANEVKYYSVCPLRGKVLDVSNCSVDKMMDNDVFFTIFSMMGLGIQAHSVINNCKTPEEAYEVIKKKTRFGKLIICTDADEDGLAIQKGILYCILKFSRFLIDFGLVYICESPIFLQSGKYFYPSDPRIPGTQFCQGMDPSKPYKRFKGLGSLNKDDVYYSFYDPSTRRLIRVTPDKCDQAMSLVEDVNERKKLLFDNNILTNPYGFKDL